MDENSFAAWLERVRAGDEEACKQLVLEYGNEIRAFIRRRLKDPKLRRLFDSEDVRQSALGQLFRCLQGGDFDLERPEDLAKLLMTIAGHKLANKVKAEQRAKRGGGQVANAESDQLQDVADGQPTPSAVVSREELLQRVFDHLSPEERELGEQWYRLDESWEKVAAERSRSESPDALRKRWTRAVQRVRAQLGEEP